MGNASTALVDRIVGAGPATMEMFTVHLGLRHGLHRALHERGRANPRELAERAGFGRVEVLPIAHDRWRFCRLGAS